MFTFSWYEQTAFSCGLSNLLLSNTTEDAEFRKDAIAMFDNRSFTEMTECGRTEIGL